MFPDGEINADDLLRPPGWCQMVGARTLAWLTAANILLAVLNLTSVVIFWLMILWAGKGG